MSSELILSVTGEGGGIRLFGERSVEGWHFHKERNESILADILGPEDEDLVDLLVTSIDLGSDIIYTLESLGSRWMILNPQFVHPLFSFEIWDYVSRSEVNGINHSNWFRTITNNNSIFEAAIAIQQSKQMVIISGAGMSVDSGVNDFRSESGWWRQIDPRTVATVESLEQTYDLFHAFYKARIEHLENVQPHFGYDVINRWKNKIQLITTQNVDGLHQVDGNQNVVELHGSIHRFRCHVCHRTVNKTEFLNKEACTCGGILRPDVVLFGESLPQDAWNKAIAAIKMADVLIVIGTSLQVYPVNQLPKISNGHLILLNKDQSDLEDDFHTVIHSRAIDGLLAIDHWVQYIQSKI